MRHSFVLSLCASTAVGVWARLLLMALAVYVGCTVLLLFVRFLPIDVRLGPVMAVLDPSVLLQCLAPQHLAAHAAVLVACLAVPILPAVLWLQAADMRAPRAARAKVMRLLVAVPVVSLAGCSAWAATRVGAALAAA